jgi:hypothetical protein
VQLNQFPKAIAEAQTALLMQQQEVRRLKDALVTYDREIEGVVAFDNDLKNETQRKFKKAELQADESYQGLLLQVRQAEFLQTKFEIDLERLRSQFSVAKLEKREAIARMELQTA